MRYFYIIIEEF